jgi:hypothetical protein
MADIRAATGTTAYEGMRARKSHLDGADGLKWSAEVEDAVKGLVNPSESESELILMASEPVCLAGTGTDESGFRASTPTRR